MTTTLSEGVKVPDVGSVNWAGDLEVNWNLLNGALANLSGNVKLDRDNIWTGEQSFTLPIVGSITGTAAKAIADEDGTSIKTGYVNIAGNQTVTGDKSFTGSNTFNNILPNATNTYSLGSSSYQWSSVYARSYYYNGTAWGLDKANVWTNDNTIAKDTSPTLYLKATNLTRGTPPSVNIAADFGVRASNGVLISQLATQITTNGNTYVYSRAYDGTRDQRVGIFLDVANNTVSYRTASNGVVNLGDSSYKWKTLNGINPGALSLPDFTSETGVSLSAGANTYTPVLSGWLSISTTGDISVVCGNFCHKATDMISVPVIAGKTYTVTMPSAATGYFYSCQGNV